jgi:hypothetical protein
MYTILYAIEGASQGARWMIVSCARAALLQRNRYTSGPAGYLIAPGHALFSAIILVMVTLDDALTVLINQGFKINEVGRGAVVKDGRLHIPVNGQLRSSAEIIAAVTPVSKDVWAFTVAEKSQEIHIYFVYGGIEFEMYEDGKRVGDRQALNQHPLDFVQRMSEEMGGQNLRRTLYVP